jgi:hypothetical protein
MVLDKQETVAEGALRGDFRRCPAIRLRWKSFSRTQRGMAIENERKPRGAKARYVSSRRSNFRNGLS